MRPLDGIRVLDFTWVVAGPVTTRILADLGADVIKVERRGSLDFGDRRGGLSGTLMRGKRSLLLDLNDPRGLDIARRLAAVSDVVIDNFSARVMTNLGLDYDALVQLRLDIICVRMTGFGLTGPDRDHVSYGPTLQALTGYTLLMAEPDGPPAGFGYSYSDLAGGNLGALAVLAALWHRRRTGRGQLVDLAQLETVASVLGPVLLDRALHGGASVPAGNASQEAPGAPHGVYPCAGEERWLAITVFTDAEWERFAGALGGAAWTRDARFATRAGRVRHAAELDRHAPASRRGWSPTPRTCARATRSSPRAATSWRCRRRRGGRCASTARRSCSPRRRPRSAARARCSASTPTRCCRGCSEWARRRSPPCAPRGCSGDRGTAFGDAGRRTGHADCRNRCRALEHGERSPR